MKTLIVISIIYLSFSSCCKKPILLQLSPRPIEILIENYNYKISEIGNDPLSSAQIISLLNDYYKSSKIKRDVLLEWGSKTSLYEPGFRAELLKLANRFSINVVYLPIPISDFDLELKDQYEKTKTK